jgi:hypothetical protein
MGHTRESRRAQISIELIFHGIALGLVLLFFLNLAISRTEEIGKIQSDFAGYGKAIVLGDRALLDPEIGNAKLAFDRPADHLIGGLPSDATAIDIETGGILQEGKNSGWCVWRAADLDGRDVLLSTCGGGESMSPNSSTS